MVSFSTLKGAPSTQSTKPQQTGPYESAPSAQSAFSGPHKASKPAWLEPDTENPANAIQKHFSGNLTDLIAKNDNDFKPRLLDLETAKITTKERYIEPEQAESERSGEAAEPVKERVTVPLSEFKEFWADGAWEMLSAFAQYSDLDLSALKTAPEKKAEALKAAEMLHKCCQRFPTMLGWMENPMTFFGGEALIALMFFGGKFLIALQAVREWKAVKAQKKTTKAKPSKKALRALDKSTQGAQVDFEPIVVGGAS